LKRKTPIERTAAIVFSTSLDLRNYLRNQVGRCGFNVVCFENESICFDNFKPIQPAIVITETHSSQVVWRFLFALHAAGADIPLVIVSDRLKAGQFISMGLQVPVHVIAMSHQDDRFLNIVSQITQGKERGGKDTENLPTPLFVGQTEAIKQIRSMLPGIAATRDPILIAGEQGTGKELLARLIAGLTKSEKCFVKIDCAKLRPDMLVNGGVKKALGVGNKGKPLTIFLDHLDQLPTTSQAEMLLLLEASQKNGNGSGEHNNHKIRFVSAADQKIEGFVHKGEFRKDLFYRLNVIPISIPPLRERKEDIAMLMDHFIIEACTKTQKCIRIPSQQARERCYMHDWPGNVKELQNQMYRLAQAASERQLLIHSDMSKMRRNTKGYLFNKLAVEELPTAHEIKDYLPALKNISLKSICDEFVSRTERRLMKKALESTSWNRKRAAELLSISYKSMLNKMKVYDII
jgi:DNA-binding NtrC family response regulator